LGKKLFFSISFGRFKGEEGMKYPLAEGLFKKSWNSFLGKLWICIVFYIGKSKRLVVSVVGVVVGVCF